VEISEVVLFKGKILGGHPFTGKVKISIPVTGLGGL
jgi:hypothetical protein